MDNFTAKSISNKSPIFPISQPHHFTDYGFEPHIDYFQVVEEARKHKRDSSSRSMDLHFKLQKPISRDESSRKIKKTKKRWWRNALLFFKFPKRPSHSAGDTRIGPLYITETRTTASANRLRPGHSTEMDIPYISLRELNNHRVGVAAAATPIYLVT